MNREPPARLPGHSDPVLVEYLRGGHVESAHRGAVCVLSGADLRYSAGDVDRPVFVRSAAKPFQLAAAVAAGAFADLDLSAAQLAVMSASHNGEPRHVDTVRRLLERGGFTEDDLRCGTHPSIEPSVTEGQARDGTTRSALHSNCSGKHTGMLLLSKKLGADPARYLEFDHPAQRLIREATQACCGLEEPFPQVAIDGCSAPTFRMPLRALARGFQRLFEPTGTSADLRDALGRIRAAIVTEPFLIAGTNRIDTELIDAGHGTVVSKVGAEGIIACGVASASGRPALGIAIKIEDGAPRAYEALLVDLLDRLGVLDDAARTALKTRLDRTVRNHRGIATGERRCLLPVDP